MSRRLRSIWSFVLVLSVLAFSGAQETPAAQQVVERFAEALSAGNTTSALELLGSGFTWSEHDLYFRTVSDPEARLRAGELVRAGVRLETEVVAIVGNGQVVIAHERMWGDFVPEGLAPLRSTTVYVVESGWLVGITRVLSAEQRDALMLAALADSTWGDALNDVYHRFDADGTYRNFNSLEDMRADRYAFSATYQLERGVLTWVADADSRVCKAGERLVMRGRMLDNDKWMSALLPDQTTCVHYRSILTEVTGAGTTYTTVRLADE